LHEGLRRCRATPRRSDRDVELVEIYDIKDVSFQQDKSIMKKQVVEGEGYDTPKEGKKVTVKVSASVDGDHWATGTKAIDFILGNGDVCDVLELAVADMKKGEEAVITVTGAAVASSSEAKLELSDVSEAKIVVFKVRLEDFEKGKDTWSMSEEEKLEHGNSRKEVGSALFKAGRLELALARYKKAVEMFAYIDNFKDDNKQKAKQLKKACELNKAMVYLKLGNYVETICSCDSILKEDRQNVKAMYRLATAHLKLKNFQDCTANCRKIVEIDPNNKEVRALLKEAHAGQKEEDKKAKGLFQNMVKALGKGPIPEPGKTPKVGNFEDEASEEERNTEAGDGNKKSQEE